MLKKITCYLLYMLLIFGTKITLQIQHCILRALHFKMLFFVLFCFPEEWCTLFTLSGGDIVPKGTKIVLGGGKKISDLIIVYNPPKGYRTYIDIQNLSFILISPELSKFFFAGYIVFEDIQPGNFTKTVFC